ncbi:MAG TPA: FHA domain-containing protein [Planctomycetota bacterium]|jgi:hypothetical protein|nr:FHA domain-containing protein [Planctomycetota bacterium]
MPERFALEVLEAGGVEERTVPLEGARATIGRKPGNAIVLADTHVSGVHAEVVEEGGRCVLRDLGSTNGTFLEGRRIEEVTLSPGDEFVVGQTRLRLLDREAEPAPRRVEAPAPARRSLALPLALLLVVAGAGAAYLQFGRRGAAEGATAVAEVPGNLLRAASFEPLEGEEPGRYWTSGEGGARFAIGGEGRRSGVAGASASFAGPGVARLEYAEEVAVEEGRGYVLAAHARGEGPSLALRALFTSSQNPELVSVRGGDFVGGGREFARVEARVVPPPGADRARLFVVAVGARGSLALDDLEMRAAEPARSQVLSVREVECAFDLLDASLKRIREPWLRRLGVSFAAGGAKYDGASVLSPSSGEVLLPSGPAGRLTASPEAAKEGIRIRYAFEPAGGGAQPAVAFEVHPEYLAQNGVALLGPAGAPEYAGDFREEGVAGLVLGEGSSRLRVGFDAPLPVVGRLRSGGFLEVEAPFAKAVEVTLQVSFEEERRRARDLVREADAEATARPADAIAKYGEVVSLFPFEKESLGRAREERARLLREGLEKVAAVQTEADEARFFRIRAAFRAAKEAATRLAASYRGTEPGERAQSLLGQIEEDARAAEEALASRDRQRRARVVEELEKVGWKKLAGLFR